MKKITVGLTIVLTISIAALLIVTAHKTGARVKGEAVSEAQRERMVLKKGGKAPVKINKIRAKGQTLPAKPFVDGEDWLKGLTVEVANTSGKTVTFLMIQVLFPHPEREHKKPGAVVFMEYGDNPFNYESAAATPLKVKPLLPGDYLELKLSNASYSSINPLLVTAGIPNHNKVEIRVSGIGFSDGTAWSGQMAQRNPKGGWMPMAGQKRPGYRVDSAHAIAQSPCRFGFPVTIECTPEFPGCSKPNFNLFDELPGDSLDELNLSTCSNSSGMCSQVLIFTEADCAPPCTFRGDTCLAHNECCSGQCDGGTCGGCEPACPYEMVCVDGLCSFASPILVDVSGDGFKMTHANAGVVFDLNGDSVAGKIAWTEANSDDALLVLDRNGNGSIDSGRELFGDITPQPVPPPNTQKNGFLALAEFDKVENGGNGDGLIGSSDAVFAQLRLWQDVNHNGVSESSELKTLSQLGVKALELNYKRSDKTDEHGNQYRYRAKVIDDRSVKIGRWAWDVFLTTAP